MTYWIAGWNLPGCLPEMDIVKFDNEDSAWDFINEEINSYSDLDDESDPYVYWVEECHGELDENQGAENYG